MGDGKGRACVLVVAVGVLRGVWEVKRREKGRGDTYL